MRIFGLVLVAAGALFAADNVEPTQAQIDEIIHKFAAHEAEFAKARENYVYRQTARIQELDDSGNTTGRWEMVSDIIFNSDGKRSEHVVRSPVPNLHQLILTPEDMEDLKSVQPFVLTTDQLPKYLIRYLGRQKVDEIGCYVFAVKPIKYEGKLRYFQARQIRAETASNFRNSKRTVNRSTASSGFRRTPSPTTRSISRIWTCG